MNLVSAALIALASVAAASEQAKCKPGTFRCHLYKPTWQICVPSGEWTVSILCYVWLLCLCAAKLSLFTSTPVVVRQQLSARWIWRVVLRLAFIGPSS